MATKIGNITIWLNVFKKDGIDKDSGEVMNQPDYRGKGEMDNRACEFALWINRDINGIPINLSGQVTEPDHE